MKDLTEFNKAVGKCRVLHGEMGTTEEDGRNGCFSILLSNKRRAICICSDGGGWDHVSIHIRTNGKIHTPNWEDMCRIKDLFFSPDECVVQFHPPHSEYVNLHPHVLHLWQNQNTGHNTPPLFMV